MSNNIPASEWRRRIEAWKRSGQTANDNGAVERELRRVRIGEKSYLFAGLVSLRLCSLLLRAPSPAPITRPSRHRNNSATPA